MGYYDYIKVFRERRTCTPKDIGKISQIFFSDISQYAATTPESDLLLPILNGAANNISTEVGEEKKPISVNIRYWKAYIRNPKPPFKLFDFEIRHIVESYFGRWIDGYQYDRYNITTPVKERQLAES